MNMMVTKVSKRLIGHGDKMGASKIKETCPASHNKRMVVRMQLIRLAHNFVTSPCAVLGGADMKKSMEWIRGEIMKLDPKLSRHNEAFSAACFLMACCIIGTKKRALQAFTGFSPHLIDKWYTNATHNGIINSGKVHHSGWFDKNGGEVAFWLDISILLGFLVRTK